MADPTSTNRAHWDALAGVHGEGRDTYYDVDALIAGTRDLTVIESEAVGDVAGLDVLHLQCHIGFDSIVLARRGARVVGADFSPASLAKARALAERCGVDLELVEADSTALPPQLHDRFDLVYATVGVLTWIADLDAWFASANAALRRGGRLVLIDVHPLYSAIGSLDPLVLDFPYGGGQAVRLDEEGSYADRDAHVGATTTIEFPHSIGEILTAALRAGLRIDAFREHLDADFDPRGTLLTRGDDGLYRLRIAGTTLPVLYTLVAART